MTAARQALHAERRKNGLRVAHVVVHEVRMTEVLRASGFLASQEPTPQEFDDALSRWIFEGLTRQEAKLWPAV